MMQYRNQVVLPMNLEIKISKKDPVRKVIEICEQLDYSKLWKTYLRTWRKFNPETMFMILVFAYVCGVYSGREIEERCRTDIRFMWILNGSEVPDNATISRFQDDRLVYAIEDLFYQFVEKLYEMDEVLYETVYIDGTKIEANANRYTFVWKKAIGKFESRLRNRLSTELPEIAKKYGLVEGISLRECIAQLCDMAAFMNLEFVHGKGKRKSQLQRDIEKLCKYEEKLESYRCSTEILGKRNSFSKTDKDATFMRLKEDHMKNGQLKPAYNVQIAVESEYIIGLGLFPNPTDTTTLIPFLQRMEAMQHRRVKNIVADAGYSSEENFTYLKEQGQNAYIKPQDYEQKKTKKYQQQIFRTENLIYKKNKDCFICPWGKKLVYTGSKKKKTANGFPVELKTYECEGCAGCPYREQCYQSKKENRTIEISQTYVKQKRDATHRITSEKGIMLRMNRSIQVEGAFGVIKQDAGFRRFLTRGKAKTETQFFLIAFAFDIQKLCNRIKNDRFHQHYFMKKEEILQE